MGINESVSKVAIWNETNEPNTKVINVEENRFHSEWFKIE